MDAYIKAEHIHIPHKLLQRCEGESFTSIPSVTHKPCDCQLRTEICLVTYRLYFAVPNCFIHTTSTEMRKTTLGIVACLLICLHGSSYAQRIFLRRGPQQKGRFRHHLLSRSRYGNAQSLKVVMELRLIIYWTMHKVKSGHANFNISAILFSENWVTLP